MNQSIKVTSTHMLQKSKKKKKAVSANNHICRMISTWLRKRKTIFIDKLYFNDLIS